MDAIEEFVKQYYCDFSQELDLVCPNATVQDAVSPEVIENIQKNNIGVEDLTELPVKSMERNEISGT